MLNNLVNHILTVNEQLKYDFGTYIGTNITGRQMHNFKLSGGWAKVKYSHSTLTRDWYKEQKTFGAWIEARQCSRLQVQNVPRWFNNFTTRQKHINMAAWSAVMCHQKVNWKEYLMITVNQSQHFRFNSDTTTIIPKLLLVTFESLPALFFSSIHSPLLYRSFRFSVSVLLLQKIRCCSILIQCQRHIVTNALHNLTLKQTGI